MCIFQATIGIRWWLAEFGSQIFIIIIFLFLLLSKKSFLAFVVFLKQ